MNEKDTKKTYWSEMPARYAAFTPPLRISPLERNTYFELVSQWNSEQQPPRVAPRVLVLGATPDFYHFPWPAGTDLLAVDHSAGMLSVIWPGSSEQSLCADWTTMDLPDASRDVVLCDGGFNFISFPDRLQQLAENVARILAPGGRLITRLYITADKQETPAELFQVLEQGGIRNINELKLRHWLALYAFQNASLNTRANSEEGSGVSMAEVWRCFRDEFKSPELLAQRVSWPEDALWRIMQGYEGKSDTYYFPSIEQFSEAFRQTSFKLERTAVIETDVFCKQHLRLLSFRRPG